MGRVIFNKNEDAVMRFICLGFHDETNSAQMSESERKSFMEGCFAYDDELRRGGHFLGGEALQAARNAATVRWRSGQVAVTDGPYAETKEQLGGILFLEARDLNHAIQLMSKHPGVRAGGFEIRAANEEINALNAARKPKTTQWFGDIDSTRAQEGRQRWQHRSGPTTSKSATYSRPGRPTL